MPIYEYQCDYCDRKFEYLVLNSIEPKQCQYCSKKNVIRRVISTCSFYKNSNGSNSRGNGSSSNCGACSSSNCSGCK